MIDLAKFPDASFCVLVDDNYYVAPSTILDATITLVKKPKIAFITAMRVVAETNISMSIIQIDDNPNILLVSISNETRYIFNRTGLEGSTPQSGFIQVPYRTVMRVRVTNSDPSLYKNVYFQVWGFISSYEEIYDLQNKFNIFSSGPRASLKKKRELLTGSSV